MFFDDENNDLFGQSKYCKKCGTELPSTCLFDLCDNCRREQAEGMGKFGKGLLAIGLGFASAWALSQTLGGSDDEGDTDTDIV